MTSRSLNRTIEEKALLFRPPMIRGLTFDDVSSESSNGWTVGSSSIISNISIDIDKERKSGSKINIDDTLGSSSCSSSIISKISIDIDKELKSASMRRSNSLDWMKKMQLTKPNDKNVDKKNNENKKNDSPKPLPKPKSPTKSSHKSLSKSSRKSSSKSLSKSSSKSLPKSSTKASSSSHSISPSNPLSNALSRASSQTPTKDISKESPKSATRVSSRASSRDSATCSLRDSSRDRSSDSSMDASRQPLLSKASSKNRSRDSELDTSRHSRSGSRRFLLKATSENSSRDSSMDASNHSRSGSGSHRSLTNSSSKILPTNESTSDAESNLEGYQSLSVLSFSAMDRHRERRIAVPLSTADKEKRRQRIRKNIEFLRQKQLEKGSRRQKKKNVKSAVTQESPALLIEEEDAPNQKHPKDDIYEDIEDPTSWEHLPLDVPPPPPPDEGSPNGVEGFPEQRKTPKEKTNV